MHDLTDCIRLSRRQQIQRSLDAIGNPRKLNAGMVEYWERLGFTVDLHTGKISKPSEQPPAPTPQQEASEFMQELFRRQKNATTKLTT